MVDLGVMGVGFFGSGWLVGGWGVGKTEYRISVIQEKHKSRVDLVSNTANLCFLERFYSIHYHFSNVLIPFKVFFGELIHGNTVSFSLVVGL